MRRLADRRPFVAAMAAVVLLAAGCAEPQPVEDPGPAPAAEAPRPMPEVRVEQVAGGTPIHPQSPEAMPRLGPGERVTLTAADTDLRALLVALAEAAGVNLVLSPAVEGRVSVRLEDVPALAALEAVIRQSGHMIAAPLRPLWGPVVFYVAPRNVDRMTAEQIEDWFGVSAELARFLVRARVPR